MKTGAAESGRRGRTRRLGAAVLAAIVATVAAGYLLRHHLPVIPALEKRLTDQLFQLRGPAPAAPAVVLVAIDQASLRALGRWPPSRTVLARAVDRLAAAGASVVVLDLLLDAPEVSGSPDDPDAVLAGAMARSGRVVLPFGFVDRRDAANASEPPPGLRAATFPVVREIGTTGERVRHPAGLLLPLDRFIEGAHPAHAMLRPDADGVLRSFPLAVRYGEDWFRSVPLEAVRLHLGLAADAILLEPGGRVVLGERTIALTDGNSLRLDWRGPAGSFDTLSFAELIADAVPRERLAGRIVLLGVTAMGVGDRHVTPLDPALPGVEVLATATENLLAGRVLHEIPPIDLAAILVAGVLAAVLAPIPWPAAAAAIVLIACLGWWATVAVAFSVAGLVVDPLFPVLALVSGTVAARGLRRGPASGVPVRGPLPAAVLFTDLAGFTGLGERLGGVATATLLRQLHAGIEARVTGHGGTVVDWTGDGALAVFGLSGEGPRAAVAALACGRQLAEETTAGRELLSCRVGIHFGPVVPTELGGPRSARASVVGDTVNVASRLEQLNKRFGTRVTVSDAVAEAVRACGEGRLLDGFEPRPPQALRGRERPLGVWTLP